MNTNNHKIVCLKQNKKHTICSFEHTIYVFLCIVYNIHIIVSVTLIPKKILF